MSRTDEELLPLAAKGDAEAISALLKEHGPQVRQRLVGKIAPTWQSVLDADDVMQVTYLEAFLHIEKFVPAGPGAFLAWLTRIAENNLRDAVRELSRAKRPDPRQRVQPQVTEDSYASLAGLLGVTTTTPSRNAAKGEAQHILNLAINALPPDYAKVVRMYDLEGRPAPEVGAALGRTPGAVYMLRARAHDQLKELLGPGSKFFSTPS